MKHLHLEPLSGGALLPTCTAYVVVRPQAAPHTNSSQTIELRLMEETAS